MGNTKCSLNKMFSLMMSNDISHVLVELSLHDLARSLVRQIAGLNFNNCSIMVTFGKYYLGIIIYYLSINYMEFSYLEKMENKHFFYCV